MEDRAPRYEDNAAGKWYVDKKCILCNVCAEVAPNHFKESETGDHDVVYLQPSTPEEEQLCMEAMADCPVEAIGNDE